MDTVEDASQTTHTFKVRRVERDFPDHRQKRRPGQDTGERRRHFSNVSCWDCGEKGHTRAKCPEHFKFKSKNYRRIDQEDGQAEAEQNSLTQTEERSGNDHGSQ